MRSPQEGIERNQQQILDSLIFKVEQAGHVPMAARTDK